MKKITTCSKFLFLILAICFCFFSAYSQEITWEDDLDVDQFYSCLEATKNGGFISGGVYYLNNQGREYWISKNDSSGNTLWGKQFGGNGDDLLSKILQTSDGGYLIGGSSNSNATGNKSENSIGGYDFWIVKTDSLGNLLWENTIGGAGADYLVSMKESGDKGFVLLGNSQSNASGDKSQNCRGVDDFWLVKIDSLGGVLWEKTIGGNLSDHSLGILQTSDKGFLLGGFSNSTISGEKTEASIGLEDYWLVKTDSLGAIQWQNTIGGTLIDQLTGLDNTKDGGFILVGVSESNISADKTENNIGIRDYWLVKTDSLGVIQWQNTIGGTKDDLAHAVVATSDGGYIIAGESLSPISGDKTEDNMDDDNDIPGYVPWIVRLDSAGIIKWQNTIQAQYGGGYYVANSGVGNIIETSNHDFVTAEYFELGYSWANFYETGVIRGITESFNSVTGAVFVDADANGVPSLGETPFNNYKVVEANSGRFTFTNPNGSYNLGVLDTGTFFISTICPNFYTSIPTVNKASFSGFHQIDSLNNFAFQPVGNVNDLWVRVGGSSQFRPGFNAGYSIQYGNAGTTILSASIVLYPDPSLTYFFPDSVPDFVSADSIVWNLGSLAPFEGGAINVAFTIPVSAQIGTLYQTDIHIFPLINDSLPASNSRSCYARISGSFDPNDILVSAEQLTTIELATQPYLDYIIRFQNTGNDTAFNIRISNPIDTNFLQISTIEFVNASHPVNLRWLYWEGNMEFKFPNVLLPDSGTNQLLSNGYVHYRIKPKTALQVGDTIPNKAFIYFDFNLPVATNIAITEIVQPNAIPAGRTVNESLSLFPNPAKDEINILFSSLTKEETPVSIFDVFGREVLSKKITATDHKILLTNLSPGVYLLKVNSQTKKFVKR